MNPDAQLNSISGQTFLVIGAAGGIGSSLVKRLASGGSRLVLAGRNESLLTDLAREVGEHLVYSMDARSFEETDSCLQAAAEYADGNLAGAALCVGSVVLKPAHATSHQLWQSILDDNLTCAFALVRSAARFMRGGGSVVFCSSAAASLGMPNHEAIAAAKAGIEGLARSAAAAHAARNLRFNAVAPGLVNTKLAAGITSNPKALEQSERMHPLGRIGQPEEVAAAIAWLLDPANSWITGEVLHIDGGLAAIRSQERRA
ncbi:MAG: SDR family NAD(P)-dependent oxidoreductase [Planctomycetota bacterium]